MHAVELRRILARREGQRPLLGCTILTSDVVAKPLILASADEVVARVRVSRRNPGPVEVDSAAARKRKLDFLGEDPATPAGGVPETGDPSQVAAAKPEGMAPVKTNQDQMERHRVLNAVQLGVSGNERVACLD